MERLVWWEVTGIHFHVVTGERRTSKSKRPALGYDCASQSCSDLEMWIKPSLTMAVDKISQ